MDSQDSKRANSDSSAGGAGGSRAQVLGDFELRQEIGRGGMGTVFEAWQKSLNRTVALKVLAHQISASPNAIKRFQREAQAAAKLHHMHITPIFAQGQDRGVHYYAMELVDGPSLAGVLSVAREGIEEKPVASVLDETVVLARSGARCDDEAVSPGNSEPASEAARTRLCRSMAETIGRPRALDQYAMVARHIATIADALDYAHRQGVVHRDIKPHNLLFGSDGHLRITDFGLARLSAEPGVTMTGEMVGSPLYMSPEQILEDRENIDHRTDIYSLGATLYEWLTGQPPYPGETRERVISQITNSDAVQPRTIRQEIPLALETICLKAMERDRRRRYQTAGEFRDDLRRFLDSQPIRARRASTSIRLQRFASRHPVAVLGVAALMVAGSLSFALFRKQSEIATKTKSLEEVTAQAVQAKQDFDRFLASAPLMMEGLPIEAGAPIALAKRVLPTVQSLFSGTGSKDEAVQESIAEPEMLGTAQGIARRASREYYESLVLPAQEVPHDEFGTLLTKARDLRLTDPRTALTLVETYLLQRPQDYQAHVLAEALYAQLGDYDAMEAGAEKLLALNKDDPSGYFWRALARFLRGETEPSLADLALIGKAESLLPWTQALHALLLMHMGQPVDAIKHLDATIANSPTMVAALLARSLAYARVWVDSKADEDILRAVSDLSVVLEQEPQNVEALTMRGQYYGSIGDFAAAANDFDAAIDLAGHSNELLAKWSYAKWAEARKAAGTVNKENAVEESVTPSPPTRTAPDDITTQSMQQWFSRFVYPGSPDQTDSAMSGSATSPSRFAPNPPLPPQVPSTANVQVDPAGVDEPPNAATTVGADGGKGSASGGQNNGADASGNGTAKQPQGSMIAP